MTLQTVLGCIGGLLAILGTVVTVTAVIIQMRSTISELKSREEKREDKDAEIDKQVVDLLVSFKQFVAAQSELNITVKGFMMAQTTINQNMVTEVSRMTKATAEGSQVIALLTEVLKTKKLITGE